ncbi:hypothetical protein [Accumulibacter sp.]|uniref:hypothetical protein n=1 Tax=Accumulibacter sp. TaxID=2053492 RepID=UPI0028C432F4|nr:hypothetical protein [Accumulibacter sp.]
MVAAQLAAGHFRPRLHEVPRIDRNTIRGVAWFVVELFSQAKHFAIFYRSSKKYVVCEKAKGSVAKWSRVNILLGAQKQMSLTHLVGSSLSDPLVRQRRVARTLLF